MIAPVSEGQPHPAARLFFRFVPPTRANLGAYQNRLATTISNLRTEGEDLTAANSRIRGVDVARETAALTKNQIMSQARTAMLAQANQLPSMALSLLGG